MEGFDISKIERKKLANMSTGFDYSCQDDTVSQFDICIGDENDL